MTSRERVLAAVSHRQPDRTPIDLCGTDVTGIHCNAMRKLRDYLGLPEKTIRTSNVAFMLADMETDLLEALGADVVDIGLPNNALGFPNDDFKEMSLCGHTVLVPGGFHVAKDASGNLYGYPRGDTSKAPSVRMPAGGLYFDTIIRQKPPEAMTWDARRDYAQDVSVLTESDCAYFERMSRKLRRETDKAIACGLCPGGHGDFFNVPGPWIDAPDGIRDLPAWLMAHMTAPEYISEAFGYFTEIGMENIRLLKSAVGADGIDILEVSATDFGTQNGPLMSVDMYREFYKPHHKKINDWVHRNTGWKTFIHCCGVIDRFIDDFIEAGFDILNPVQINDGTMRPSLLKERFGSRISFWGGAVNAQTTMNFGTADEVAAESGKNTEIFGRGGGYIAASVHNIQANVKPENIMAMFTAAKAAALHSNNV